MAESLPCEAVNTVRSKLSENVTTDRLKVRHKINDSHRVGVDDIKDIVANLDNITEKDVVGLSARIKRKKTANEHDLNRLSHAFLQNSDNITTFFKITGALHVVIKVLTGNDSITQISACECLCNMALGNDVICEKIAICAGIYLIPFVESSNQRLAITSLWTISNILLSKSNKAVSSLLLQGLMSKLISVSTSKSVDEKLAADAKDCIYLAVCNHKAAFRAVDKIVISYAIIDLMATYDLLSIETTYYTLHLLEFQLDKSQCLAISEHSILILCKFIKDEITDKLSVMFVLRIIANMLGVHEIAELVFHNILEVLSKNQLTVSKLISKLAKKDLTYKKELLWLCGNVCRFSPNYLSSCYETILNLHNLLNTK